MPGADRDENSDAARAETAGCEVESEERRGVEPLEVVDRHDDRPVGGQPIEDAEHGRSDRSLVGRLGIRSTKERDLERPSLRRREPLEDAVSREADQIREPGERERRLGLRRARRQHPVPEIAGALDTG